MDEVSETCIFCGSSDLFHKRQTIAGEKVSVCRVCAGYGGQVYKTDSEARAALRCLHLVACDLERALDFNENLLFSREERTLRAIRAGLNASAFVLACPCPACGIIQVQHDGGVFAGPPVDLFKIDGVSLGAEFEREELTLSEMRSVKGSDAAVAARKARNIAETALTDDERAPLQACADSVPNPTFRTVGEVLGLRRADDQARAHWSMVERYGPGLRDGDFWVGRDGSVIPLTAAEKAVPMTAADHLALSVDHRRAEVWRASRNPSAEP